MLEEKSYLSVIQILADGQMQIRRSDIILRDGNKVSEKYHRHCIAPGDDISKEDQRVKDIANVIWTKKVIDDYKAEIAKSNLPL